MAKKQHRSTFHAKKIPHVAKPASSSGKPRLYTLVVFLLEGPFTKKFTKRDRKLFRTIQIRGDQTLEDLHDAIFKAFDRYDEHMYEFNFGKKPGEAPRFVTPFAAEDSMDEPFAGIVVDTTLDSLGLKKGQSFGYWFDFGDDWYHQLDVESIDETIPPGKYPQITERVGESPPQYPIDDTEWRAREPSSPDAWPRPAETDVSPRRPR